MRVINRASLVVQLKDMYDKSPIMSASILCNGKQNPYTKKVGGYYVFSNLFAGEYEVSISCGGYVSMKIPVEIKENDTTIIEKMLSYNSYNPAFENKERFEFTVTQDGELIKKTDILLRLDDKIDFIKLIKPIEKGSQSIFLNVQEDPNYMLQQYSYVKNTKNYDIFIAGYDDENKCYVLKDPAEEQIETEGHFKPIWRVKTDEEGKILFPIMNQFMKNDIINFTVINGEKKCRTRVNRLSKRHENKLYKYTVRLK